MKTLCERIGASQVEEALHCAIKRQCGSASPTKAQDSPAPGCQPNFPSQDSTVMQKMLGESKANLKQLRSQLQNERRKNARLEKKLDLAKEGTFLRFATFDQHGMTLAHVFSSLCTMAGVDSILSCRA